MATVTRLERITITVMEPNLCGDTLNYYEKETGGSAWRCDECGLVWDRKSYAEGCADRGHKTNFEQTYYGRGALVNGVFTGTVTTYERRPIRQDGIRVAAAK